MAVVDAEGSFKFHVKELKEHLKKANDLADILSVSLDEDPKELSMTFVRLRKAIVKALEHFIVAEEYYWLWRSEKHELGGSGGGQEPTGEGNG